mmetsp:Transcript_64012/g.169497  ORF Transcript_64012/g.169497 Transcript_64012/m.169497 type:complete len:145 (+) Transcript_64012:214-648(+)
MSPKRSLVTGAIPASVRCREPIRVSVARRQPLDTAHEAQTSPLADSTKKSQKKQYARVHNSKELNAHRGYVIGDLVFRILHPSVETLQREFFCGGISIRFVEVRDQGQCLWVVDELPNTVSAEQQHDVVLAIAVLREVYGRDIW